MKKLLYLCGTLMCGLMMSVASAQSRADILSDKILTNDTTEVLVVAHRGDWRYAPENSIAAIEHSIEIGVDIVELDLQMSKDSVLFVIHDSKLDRTTTGTGRIGDWTSDSLRTLKLKNGAGIKTPHHLPTLKEAMLAAKGKVLVNLDKADRYFDLIMPILEETGTAQQVIMKGTKSAGEVDSLYGRYLDRVIYMPKVRFDNSDAIPNMKNYMAVLNPSAFELSFSTQEFLDKALEGKEILRGNAMIWYNALWDTQCGGHDDELALSDPDAAFGFLIDSLGARIIQTDRAEYLLNYLRSRSLHKLVGGNSEGFTTRLEISGFQDSTKLIARIHDGDYFSDWRFDTIRVVNGIAELRDVSKATEPARMYIFTDSGTITTYVQNGHSEYISGKVADIEKETLHYQGAPWSKDMMIYNNEVGGLIQLLDNKSKNFMSISDEEKHELIDLYSSVDSLLIAYLKNYPNSWHALSTLETKMMDMTKSDIQKIYDALETEQRESKYGEILKKYLSVRTIEVGDNLNAFNIIAKDQGANEINLMEIKEPYILLDFSQCYCGPCIAATKEIQEIKGKYEGKVAFINYSCDDSENDWKKMVDRDNITWSSLYDGEGSVGSICLKYGVNSYPTFFLFGPERTLINRIDGYGPGMLDSYLNGFIK